MKLNIWNLEYITIGDLELKRRKIKGLIAELDTIVIPIIALNLTFLFSVDSWQLFIPIIALKRAIFFGVKSWLLIPIFTLNWTIFLDVDSRAFYPSLWFKLDNFRSCQKSWQLGFLLRSESWANEKPLSWQQRHHIQRWHCETWAPKK